MQSAAGTDKMSENGVTAATDALSATALTHSHAGTPRAFSMTLPDTPARPQANRRVNLGGYGRDDDGLIEVSTLDHLNAIRWDLDGDGGVSSANATNYANAFLNRVATVGFRRTPKTTTTTVRATSSPKIWIPIRTSTGTSIPMMIILTRRRYLRSSPRSKATAKPYPTCP